jgi:hypothetical protein
MDWKRATFEAINHHMGNANLVTAISMERRG